MPNRAGRDARVARDLPEVRARMTLDVLEDGLAPRMLQRLLLGEAREERGDEELEDEDERPKRGRSLREHRTAERQRVDRSFVEKCLREHAVERRGHCLATDW